MPPANRVQPGGTIEGLSAKSMNDALAAGELWKPFTRGQQVPTPGGRVPVINQLNEDLDVWSVCQLGDPITQVTDDQEFRDNPVRFQLAKPSAPSQQRVVILQAPVAADARSLAVESGVAKVTIDVKETWHRRADILDDDFTKLESHPSGCCEILWKPNGTGEKSAIVIVGPFVSLWIEAKTNVTIPAGDGNGGEVSIYDNGSDTGEDVTAIFDWQDDDEDISSDKECMIQWDSRSREWHIRTAECE